MNLARLNFILASKLVFFFVFLSANPSILRAQDPALQIEGRVFTQFGPLPEARVHAFKSFADLGSGAAFLISQPTDTNGVYKLELPPGEYLFTARGKLGDKEYLGYHGNNPISIGKETWLTLMTNEIKPPRYSKGQPSLGGIVTYKGEAVHDAYVTVFREGTPTLKGLGFMTESNRADASFNLAVPPGKYLVIAKKMSDKKRIRPLKEGDLYCYYPANPVEIPSDRAITIEIPCYPKGDRTTFSEAAKIKPDTIASLDQLSLSTNSGVKGKVTDSQGNPVPGLFVLAYRVKPSVFLMHQLSNRADYSAETNANGTYFVPIDADGEYHIVARNVLGGSPQAGDLFGLFEGNPARSVNFKKGQLTEKINIVVGRSKEINAQLQPLAASLPDAPHAQHVDNVVLEKDTVWKGKVTVDGKVTVKRGVTLLIEPGTEIKFNKRDVDQSGVGASGILVEGKILARGTPEKRIIFTSSESKPDMRDWSYILLMTAGQDNEFEYCEFKYSFTGLQIQYSGATIKNCLFDRNHEGLRFNSANLVVEHNNFKDNNVGIGFGGVAGRVMITDNQLNDNRIGVLFMRPRVNAVDFSESQGKPEPPLFRNNNIVNSSIYNYKIGENQAIDINISYNWWGSDNAQTIGQTILDKKDDPTLGKATFEPFLQSPAAAAGVR